MANKSAYKILSTRLPIVDIASSIELCNKYGIPVGAQGSAINKALSFLLSNLRSSGALEERTLEESLEFIESCFSGKHASVGTIILAEEATKVQRPKRKSAPKLPAIPASANSPRPSGSFAGHTPSLRSLENGYDEDILSEVPQGDTAFELSSEFEEAIAEDVRAFKQLEDEELLSSILITEHRGDDRDIKLIDPSTIGVPKEIEE